MYRYYENRKEQYQLFLSNVYLIADQNNREVKVTRVTTSVSSSVSIDSASPSDNSSKNTASRSNRDGGPSSATAQLTPNTATNNKPTNSAISSTGLDQNPPAGSGNGNAVNAIMTRDVSKVSHQSISKNQQPPSVTRMQNQQSTQQLSRSVSPKENSPETGVSQAAVGQDKKTPSRSSSSKVTATKTVVRKKPRMAIEYLKGKSKVGLR